MGNSLASARTATSLQFLVALGTPPLLTLGTWPGRSPERGGGFELCLVVDQSLWNYD